MALRLPVGALDNEVTCLGVHDNHWTFPVETLIPTALAAGGFGGGQYHDNSDDNQSTHYQSFPERIHRIHLHWTVFPENSIESECWELDKIVSLAL
jgi:hypothetical protein